MRRRFFFLMIPVLTAFFPAALSAQVTQVNEPLSLDGALTGNGWAQIPDQTGFLRLKASGKTEPEAQTSFKVAADGDALYMSVLCQEPEMKKVNLSPSGPMWGTNAVEIFLSPTGQSDEYYQFAVTAGGNRYCMFYGEAGVIRPDPYHPFWESKVFHGANFWQLQVKIPFSAFYMTRNNKWKSEWLLNVARTRTPVQETSSWSPLQNNFQESRNFRTFTGFPKRKAEQDIAILKAEPSITGFADGVYSGPLALTVEADPAAAGMYELSVEEPEGKRSVHKITLKTGRNEIVLPRTEYFRRAQGKTLLRLTLKSEKTGETVGRSYPVDIRYEPVKIVLKSPGYRRNFYPGQDHSTISGELHLRLSPAVKETASVTVTLSGEGLTEKTETFNAEKDVIPFAFGSDALPEGGKALLCVKIQDRGREISSVSETITRLKKGPGSMLWIEDGRIVKDGKPVFFRTMSAFGYHGGAALAERLRNDDLGFLNPAEVTLEPARLIRGIESREATKDVKPCPEMYEQLREVVESRRNGPDFDVYYLCDEPECRNISPVYLKYLYDYLCELDPYHPAVICSRSADRYIDCADILRTHPYINPVVSGGKRILNIPIHQVRNYLMDITKFGRPDKVPVFTGQFFSYKFNNYMADYPTWEELESMSWSALAQGSRSFWPYAYHDLGDRPRIYEGARYFNQSIKALEKQLLSNQKYPVKAVDPEKMIDTLLVEGDGVTLLIVVNLKDGPLETEISSDHLKKIKSLLEFRGNGSRELDNGRLKLSLKPYECVVLTSKKMDEGLKTRDRVLKEIDEAEKLRCSHGSLLFEKGTTFEIDSSNPGNTLGVKAKLFDGVRDVFAWQAGKWAKEAWFELNFRKNPPRFSKIGLYGNNMGTPSVRIWKAGEWLALTPKKTDVAPYMVLLDFEEEWKTVKVRIDFPERKAGQAVELYEIELLK